MAIDCYYAVTNYDLVIFLPLFRSSYFAISMTITVRLKNDLLKDQSVINF